MKKTVSMALSLALLLTGMSLFRASATDADTDTAHDACVSDTLVPDTPAPDVPPSSFPQNTPDADLVDAQETQADAGTDIGQEPVSSEDFKDYYMDENGCFVQIPTSSEASYEESERFTLRPLWSKGCYVDENGYFVCDGTAVTSPDSEDFNIHAVSQLSQEQLDASTEELLDTILQYKYPYLESFILCSSGDDDAYQNIYKNFNGMREFESRPDAASTILSKLINLKANSEDLLGRLYLYTMLHHSQYYHRLTPDEVAILPSLREGLFVDVSTTDVEPEQTQNSVTLQQEVYNTFPEKIYPNGLPYHLANTYDYTTSGTIVPLYVAEAEFSPEMKDAMAERTCAQYNVTKIANPTTVYNCHSYAWYLSSASNPFWIADQVEFYINDPHCIEVSTPTVGSIVVYKSDDSSHAHSAVVTSVYNGAVTCISKWGADGLYEHNIADVPSSYKNGGRLDCKYYNYSLSHTGPITSYDSSYHTRTCTVCSQTFRAEQHICSVTNINSATHTRVCDLCGWSETAAHVENVKTGRCITCGLKGPFMVDISSLPVLPEDTQSDETEDIVA